MTTATHRCSVVRERRAGSTTTTSSRFRVFPQLKPFLSHSCLVEYRLLNEA